MQKGFSKIAVVGVVIGILVVAGIVWAQVSGNNSEQPEAMTQEEKMTEQKGDAMMDDEKKDSEGAMVQDDSAMMEKAGTYKDYSPEVVAAEQAAGNKVVLFFHAPWCPFCKAADAQFRSRASEIPAGVALLRTDYDSNTALRQKYGVTYQHTFVQIDSSGGQVSKWSGGDIDNLKKYLK